MEGPLPNGAASAAAARPKRLIISKMELENFKSYAGVQEIGPFEKCFSAVVGPNGSGKSNVIDAMLFVFGKRAKQMRQAKVRGESFRVGLVQLIRSIYPCQLRAHTPVCIRLSP